MTKVFGGTVALCLFLIVGSLDLASALTDEAIRKDPPHAARAVPAMPAATGRYWTMDSGARAATLDDCYAGARLSISYNNGTGAPWRRFCADSASTSWRIIKGAGNGEEGRSRSRSRR